MAIFQIELTINHNLVKNNDKVNFAYSGVILGSQTTQNSR